MKWLIVEDALSDRNGYWLEYISTFVRELRALGDEVVVLCDRKAQGFVVQIFIARWQNCRKIANYCGNVP